MIKLLHLGDLHLDSPFKSLPYNESVKMRENIRKVFSHALRYAREERCDIVLISGDLFDREFYSAKTLSFLVDSFRNMPECRFVISPGNHDPYKYFGAYMSEELPENVTVFKNESVECVEYNDIGVTVYGYAFTSDSYEDHPLSVFSVKDRDRFNVLCAHADTDDARSKYATVTSDELLASGLDYAALGHIHTKPEIMKSGGTVYAYSGCLAGRDFTEYGEKGGILVTLDGKNDKKSVKAKRVTFCPWVYETVRVDVSGCMSTSDISERAKDAILALPDNDNEYIIKIELNGMLGFDNDTEKLMSELFSFGVKQIEDKTVISPDFESLENDYSIRGEFYRKLRPMIESNDSNERKIASQALRYGLMALDGADIK